MSGKRAFEAVALGVTLVVSAVASRAQPAEVDSEWLPPLPGECSEIGAGLIGGGYSVAQPFTAGRQGILDRLEVRVRTLPRAGLPAGPLRIEIRALDDAGLPSWNPAVTLFSVELESAAFSSFPEPTAVNVRAAGIRVAAGDRLAIVIAIVEPPLPESDPQYELCGADGYPGGTSYAGTTGWPPWFERDWDLAFRTWVAAEGTGFVRGDANASGVIDIADSVTTLNWLFLGGGVPPCVDAADINDDGDADVSDAVALLNWLFLGGEAPPAPGPLECGSDPTEDELDCGSFEPCAELEDAL